MQVATRPQVSYLALWAIVASVASPGGLSHGAFVLLLTFL